MLHSNKRYKLIIIGNGFDIAHGIPSKYEDLKDFLIDEYNISLDNYPYISSSESKHGDVLVNQYESAKLLAYGIDTTGDYTKWSKFESDLGNMDFVDLIPDRDWYLDKEGDPDESYYSEVFESHFTDFIHMIEFWPRLIKEWITYVNDFLLEKIDSLKLNPKIEDILDRNTIVLSFNYTETIEALYDFHKIIHIHNKVGDDTLIFGHGDEKIDASDLYEYDDQQYNAYVNNYYKKDVYLQMSKYFMFFDFLKDKSFDVYSFGFDYSEVDLPYIKEIINNISINSRWFLNNYDDCYDKQKEILLSLGFEGEIIEWDGN